MRRSIKIVLAVLAGGGMAVAAFRLRRRQLSIVTGTFDLDTGDPLATLEQLGKLMEAKIPGFPGFNLGALQPFNTETDPEPRTIGEILEEVDFIENLRVCTWPYTNDTALDVVDDDFKVVIDTKGGGKATLVEHEQGFHVVEYVSPSGTVVDTLPEAFTAEVLLSYSTFLKLVEEYGLDATATEPDSTQH